jgi:hypothetical protein
LLILAPESFALRNPFFKICATNFALTLRPAALVPFADPLRALLFVVLFFVVLRLTWHSVFFFKQVRGRFSNRLLFSET